MPALTISANGLVLSVPARRLLTRQAAPKAASAPTNAKFYWLAADHMGRVAKRSALLVFEVEHPGREDSPSSHRRIGD